MQSVASDLKKIYMLLFLTFLLLQLFVLSTNHVQAQPDELVEVRLSINIFDVDPKTNLADVNIHVFVPNFPSNISTLYVHILGGGSAHVPCENRGPNGVDKWFYQGESNQTTWVLIGDCECYPFNSYTLTFRVEDLPSVQGNFSLITEDVDAIFVGANFRYLRNTWETENDLIPISKITTKEVVFNLQKTLNALTSDVIYSLIPIVACYYLLGATLILNPKDDLGGRLRLYLSLFVFSSTFLFTLQSYLPFRSSLSFPELLLSNLTFSTAIFTIASIISNKTQNPWELREKIGFYSRVDSLGLIFALIVFVIFYSITLFGKLNIITAIIFTYIVVPSYPFALLFNIPKRKITKHKLKWALFLILALFPLELLLFVKLITLWG